MIKRNSLWNVKRRPLRSHKYQPLGTFLNIPRPRSTYFMSPLNPRPALKFYGDADGDGIINGLDCDPYNKKRGMLASNMPTQKPINSNRPASVPTAIQSTKINSSPQPGAGYSNTTNSDGSVTLGWNAGIRNNDGSRTYPLPVGVPITNLKQYSDLNRRSDVGSITKLQSGNYSRTIMSRPINNNDIGIYSKTGPKKYNPDDINNQLI